MPAFIRDDPVMTPHRNADFSEPPTGDDGQGAEKAVALRHERDSAAAPRIVAKGTGSLAEQIIEIAFEHGIKVRKDADLTEILSQIDVESEIPLEAFAAVAEILSYIYRANGEMGKAHFGDGTGEAVGETPSMEENAKS